MTVGEPSTNVSLKLSYIDMIDVYSLPGLQYNYLTNDVVSRPFCANVAFYFIYLPTLLILPLKLDATYVISFQKRMSTALLLHN